MKQQILIIHGGTSFETHEEYLRHLQTTPIDLDDFRRAPGWKMTLQSKLGEKYDVLNPRMPDSTNSRYEEWKIWFERIAELLDDNVILLGHSLGSIFLAKYLSENIFAKKIKALIMVAPPFEGVDEDSISDFLFNPKNLAKIPQQTDKIFLLHSKDDPVVPYSHSEKYQEFLAGAKLMSFEDREHFNQDEFPEIIKLIKSI